MSTAINPELRRVRPVLFAALGLVTLAGLTACGGDGEQDQASSGDTASVASGMPSPGGQGGAMAEMRQLQKQLRSISKRAMQDSALQRQMKDVQALIDRTMREMNPRAGNQMDRMDSLRGQLQTAQSEGDTTRMRSLITEAQKLQRSIQKLRNKAMQREDVAKALKQFQEDLRAEMREIDPAADSLMDRADSLQKQMQSQAQGMMGGAASDTGGG